MLGSGKSPDWAGAQLAAAAGGAVASVTDARAMVPVAATSVASAARMQVTRMGRMGRRGIVVWICPDAERNGAAIASCVLGNAPSSLSGASWEVAGIAYADCLDTAGAMVSRGITVDL